jgi:hypothetical protein
MYLIIPAALGKIIMFLRSKVRRVRNADKLTTICEPTALQSGILNISQPYRPRRPVTEIASLSLWGALSDERSGLSIVSQSLHF